MGNIKLTNVRPYTISDIKYISIQNISARDAQLICCPNNNNYTITYSSFESGQSALFVNVKEFNAIGIFDVNKELLAYHIFDIAQGTGNDFIITNWEITVTNTNINEFSIDIKSINITDIFNEHANSVDSLVGYHKTDTNEGIINYHSGLRDVGIASLQDTAENVNEYCINKSGYISRDDSDRSNIPETDDTVYQVKNDTIVINKYNKVIKNTNIPTSATDVVYETGTGKMHYIQNGKLDNSTNILYPNKILKPRVEIDKYGRVLIQDFDSNKVPKITCNGTVVCTGILSPNYCVTGTIGFIYQAPKRLLPLLEYYWAISDAMKMSCKELGDIIWSSPVPLYSGMNDSILYSLLKIYESKGYISNILISTLNTQEAIQFTVIKRYYGEDDVEMRLADLLALYNFQSVALTNYMEQSHSIEPSVIWDVTNKDLNTAYSPRVPEARIEALMPIDYYSATGTDTAMNQVRYLPWLAGKIYTEVILPDISNITEYNFYNTGVVILKKGSTTSKITVILYTSFGNYSTNHVIDLSYIPTKAWLDNNILYVVKGSRVTKYDLSGPVLQKDESSSIKIANNGFTM